MSSSRIFHFIFWPLLVIIAFILFSNHSYSADEGMILNSAWQLWHGKAMYIDFYEFLTPGSAYSIYWLWSIFSNPDYFYLVAKIFGIILWLLSAVAMYLIGTKITKNKILIIFSILLWLFASRYYALINHNYFSSFAAVWLLYFLIISLEKKKLYLYFITGLLASLVFLFLQTKGLILFLLILIIYIFYKNKNPANPNPENPLISRILVTTAGFTLPIVCLLFFWPANKLFYSWFIFPNEINYLSHKLFSPLILTIELLTLIILFAFAYFYKKKIYWLIFFFQIALFIASFNSIELFHFLINAFPVCIMAGVFFQKIFKFLKLKIWHHYLLYGYLIIVALAYTLAFIPLKFEKTIYNFDTPYFFNIPELKQAQHIYAGPFLPHIYFEFKKPNPFPYTLTYLCDQTCRQEILDIFKQTQPEFAILAYSRVDKFGYNRDNVIDNYIKDNYQECFYYKDVKIMSKNKCFINHE